MTEKEFYSYAAKNLKRFLPPGFEDAEITTNEVVDPVRGKQTFLNICWPGANVFPRVSLNQFQPRLRDQEDPDEILLGIAEGVARFRAPVTIPQNFQIEDYNALRDRLSTRLFDIERSKDYLEDKIWRPVAGFALVYRFEMPSAARMVLGAPITRDMFDLWDIDEEQLFRDTMKNEEEQRPARMFNALDMYTAKNILEKPKKFRADRRGRYVLTTFAHINGATAVARPGLLENIADIFGCSYWVLPTSAHEMMLCPDLGYYNLPDLEKVVHDGNRNRRITPQEDVLSDKVHYFDREAGELRCAQT